MPRAFVTRVAVSRVLNEERVDTIRHGESELAVWFHDSPEFVHDVNHKPWFDVFYDVRTNDGETTLIREGVGEGFEVVNDVDVRKGTFVKVDEVRDGGLTTSDVE
ncbi:MAG: hypothetical protein QXQ53_01165 [Candidatus Methanosuratincola sp.]